jgi:uncharacterized Fe-S cluster protein YjdI
MTSHRPARASWSIFLRHLPGLESATAPLASGTLSPVGDQTAKAAARHEEERNMTEVRKTYTHEGVTVVWQPALCIHSTNCFHGLPGVFDPNRRPWIDASAADAQAIIDQVAKCPSGALSIATGANAPPAARPAAATTIDVLRDGPLLVQGTVTLKRADGTTETKEGSTALCRCGASKNKPFCDGSHKAVGFVG